MSQSSTEIRGDQLAPHSIEAEEAVLGAISQDPETMSDVVSFLRTEDFFLVRHGWIWDAMVALRDRKDPIDYLTLTQELEQAGKLSEVGGAAYLISLINKTPSGMNVEGYGRIVERMALRRRLIEAAQQVARVAHSDETDIDEVVSKSELALDRALAGYTGRDSIRTGADVVDLQFARALSVAGGEVVPSSKIPTGIMDLGALIGGFRNDDLAIIAARPSMGKSSLLLQIATNTAKDGAAVGYLTFEDSANSVMTRVMASASGIDYLAIRDDAMTEGQLMTYGASYRTVREWAPRVILEDDILLATWDGVRRTARKMVFEHGIRALFVDYLQKIHAPYRMDNRVQEISMVARELKNVAKELHIPVVAACQLNRALEVRSDKRPIMSDLRESGEIEQEADVIGFIYRDGYYDPDSPDGMRAEIHIAKHRNGPTGIVDTVWIPERFRFENAAKKNVDLNRPQQKPARQLPEPTYGQGGADRDMILESGK